MSAPAGQAEAPEDIQAKPNDATVARVVGRVVRATWGIVAVAVLAGIPFTLGKYFEFNSQGPYDSAAHVYSARHIVEGARLGVQERPSAQLGTLAVNIVGVWVFGYNETGPVLIQCLLQAAALVTMFLAMRRLFGLLPAGVGAVVAALYLSSPIFAKFGNVKEQYMIAFMVLGVSFLIFRQLGGPRLWAVLAGAALAWAPLFKPTGVSAIAAAGVFLLLQPFLKHQTWKQTGTDILLMLAGAAAALAPLCFWLAVANAPAGYWPYYFVWRTLIPSPSGGGASYVSGSRQLLSFARQAPIVGRFYLVLILPVAMAFGAIIARAVTWALGHRTPAKAASRGEAPDRLVVLLATWWILDMAFVWISPRSYEQYYLPLNASGAMLGGYLVGLYANARRRSARKWPWNVVGLAGALLMAGMAWHIVFGLRTDPQTGFSFEEKFKGYVQRYRRVARKRREGLREHWEAVGDYIRENTRPDDTIYVWGWVPGIYVRAQRFSASPGAFTSEMHVVSPEALARMVRDLLIVFHDEPPKFIVDSRMTHFPWNRRPLELWPITSAGPLQNDPVIVARFDEAYYRELTERVGRDEAERYKAMKPFRTFVMSNYRFLGTSGTNVLLKRKRAR